jgi:hypothetical protein
MKLDLDMLFGCVIAGLVILFSLQAKQAKELQIQIDELKIVVDQKFLPAMILETPTVREEYEKNN